MSARLVVTSSDLCVCVHAWRCVLVSGNLHVGVRMCAYMHVREEHCESTLLSRPCLCSPQALEAVLFRALLLCVSLWRLCSSTRSGCCVCFVGRLLEGLQSNTHSPLSSLPPLISLPFSLSLCTLKGLGAGRISGTLSYFLLQQVVVYLYLGYRLY